jgi:CTP:molybdopterin cytidylyltransferase MocA
MTRPRITTIVLAAGAATRFGSQKQLASFNGEPLLRRAVRHALSAGVESVTVVVGSNADLVSKVVDDLPGVRLAVNHEWRTGIASSIWAGISRMPVEAVDGLLLLAADQPLVDASALRVVIGALSPERRLVVAEYGEVIGVPALIGWEHVSELVLNVSGDRGAASWLRSRGELVTRMPLPEAAYDVDTVEGLAAIEQLMQQRSRRRSLATPIRSVA